MMTKKIKCYKVYYTCKCYGVTTIKATTKKEAIELAEQEPFDDSMEMVSCRASEVQEIQSYVWVDKK